MHASLTDASCNYSFQISTRTQPFIVNEAWEGIGRRTVGPAQKG